MKISRLARAFSWPMKSPSFSGRSEESASSSLRSGDIRRVSLIVAPLLFSPPPLRGRSTLRSGGGRGVSHSKHLICIHPPPQPSPTRGEGEERIRVKQDR